MKMSSKGFNREYNRQDRIRRRLKLKEEMAEWLAGLPGKMARKEDFIERIADADDAQSLLSGGDFIEFLLGENSWVQNSRDHTSGIRKQLQEEAQRKVDAAWQACLPESGPVLRRNAKNYANTPRLNVIARTYSEGTAAKRLELPAAVVRSAVKHGALPSFIDPEGRVRIPAQAVEAAFADANEWEKIAGFSLVKAREIALVAGISYETARRRLHKAGLSAKEAAWAEIKGKWGLPAHWKEFQRTAEERFQLQQEAVFAEQRRTFDEATERIRAQFESDRRERQALRQKMLEIFPTWDRDRGRQHFYLHLGPTNSGKTYQSLARLSETGSGWYLAPLRLLAHEVFDTLNKNGVRCNLLTGEEAIPVDGARITAATIEMFDSHHSGECVLIDEAHMISDSQRGWAWTRAIMENNANEVHIIGAPIVEPLITRMLAEIDGEMTVETHQRLTPLEVSDKPWSLFNLPAKTILVAFSRRMVLGLKAELEREHHRTVSVVYGNLPPEVRLNQAERFSSGQTEICVATDAIGMGLNLPADNVCFFETSKFDGKQIRQLTSNEIRQIGGRAGRFGLSEGGLIGALTQDDLLTIQNAIYSETSELEYGYVAPTPETIALMPGKLDEKLKQWVDLAGIPARWKEMLKPTDLTTQIELAALLSVKDVKMLGEETALLLINAPCYRETQSYWQACASSIIHRTPMPVITNPRLAIKNAHDMELYETAIRAADIYLWLAQRPEFRRYGPQQERVRAARYHWSMEVDAALVKKIDTTRRCPSCGRKLELGHRFNLCERCFRERRFQYEQR